MSQEEIGELADATIEGLLADIAEVESERQTRAVFEQEQLRQLERTRVEEGLQTYVIREIVAELAREQRDNKLSVGSDVVRDLAAEVLTDEMRHVGRYVAEKQRSAQLRALCQMRRYFRRWQRSTRDTISARRSLVSMPAAPRMADAFTVCEQFRGKVRQIRTGWFGERDEAHPFICRLELQAARCPFGVPVPPTGRSVDTQTDLTHRDKTPVAVGDFVRSFVRTRLLAVLEGHARVLQTAAKVDPAPERIIAEYHLVLEAALALVDPRVRTALQLRLPTVAVIEDIPGDWQARLDAVLVDWGLLPEQRRRCLQQCRQITQLLGHSGRGLSASHLRLFPWIDIVTVAVGNKLNSIDRSVAGIIVEVDRNAVTVVGKLQLGE